MRRADRLSRGARPGAGVSSRERVRLRRPWLSSPKEPFQWRRSSRARRSGARQLTPEQYEILRNQGTERPFTGRYVDTKADGTYCCAACGNELFSADTKFESGTGWPSFFEPADNDAIETRPDNSLMMRRTEVLCARCGSHLGHLFDDGPEPTGQRFCINSCALDLDSEGPKAS